MRSKYKMSDDDEQTPPEEQKPKPLTERQLRLVDAYASSGNATDAARKAGYANPNIIGPVLVKNSGPVRDAIQRHREEAAKTAALTRDEGLGTLASIIASPETSAKDRIAALALKSKIMGWEAARKIELAGANGGPIQMQAVPVSQEQALDAIAQEMKRNPQFEAELQRRKLGDGK